MPKRKNEDINDPSKKDPIDPLVPKSETPTSEIINDIIKNEKLNDSPPPSNEPPLSSNNPPPQIVEPANKNKKMKIEKKPVVREKVIINQKLETLDDLIELAQKYDPTKDYNFNLKRLHKILPPLIKLKNVIGMKSVKDSIVGQIVFFLNEFDGGKNQDMLHTIIQGPPGVGKTTLGKIIGELNDWITPIDLTLVDRPENANFEVFVGSVNDCKVLDPSMRFTLAKNWGVQHSQLSFDGNEIVKSFVFIDLYRAPNLRVKKILLRKKIAQALGFFHEIEDTKESIFQSGFSEHTDYTKLDKELIQLLYQENLFETLENKSEKIVIAKNQLSVKTNLFADNATLSVSPDLINREGFLYNFQGQLIKSFWIEATETVISTADFQSGVYFFRIDNLPAVKITKQ